MTLYLLWLVAYGFKLAGAASDASYHFKWLRDTWQGPHLINLVGFGISILLILYMWRNRAKFSRTAMAWIISGVSVFVGAAPLDEAWHRAFGLDLTSFSPTHFLLYTGTGMMIWGVMLALHADQVPVRWKQAFLLLLCVFFLENMLFPLGQQEYGVPGMAAIRAGHPIASPELLAFSSDPARTASGGVPTWVYPLYLFGLAAFGLMVARRATRLPAAAFMTMTIYLAYRGLAAYILFAMHWPVSFIPYFIVALAVVVDVVDGAERWRLPAAAVVGTGVAYAWGVLMLRSGVVMPDLALLALPFSALTAWIGLELGNLVGLKYFGQPEWHDNRAQMQAVLRRFSA